MVSGMPNSVVIRLSGGEDRVTENWHIHGSHCCHWQRASSNIITHEPQHILTRNLIANIYRTSVTSVTVVLNTAYCRATVWKTTFETASGKWTSIKVTQVDTKTTGSKHSRQSDHLESVRLHCCLTETLVMWSVALSTFKVIHLLQVFSNVVFQTDIHHQLYKFITAILNSHFYYTVTSSIQNVLLTKSIVPQTKWPKCTLAVFWHC